MKKKERAMAVEYTGMGVRPVGTLTCERCGAKYHDGIAETEAGAAGLIHRRAHERAGWRLYRPVANPDRADELCPDCPSTY
uniref:PSQ10.16c n=1 Tax=Nocardiopsis sp. 90127 TaxID=373213 RepID=Q27I72_9ACTN|nr:pSQ10.16c [Nocardiopsis sp. 90127]